MLEGFDETWIDAGNRQYASYTNVPAGNYFFKIKTTNSYGEWSDVLINIPIRINPPFWNTWWFISLCVITIAACIFAVYRYRINQLKKLFSIRTKISRDLHDEVGSTLSGVALFSEIVKQKMPPGSDADAGNYLDRIALNSKEMVEKMNDIVWAINPQNDSFERIIQKLHGYAANICTTKDIRLYFESDASGKKHNLDMQSRKNLYLITKEAINNAVKYSECKNLFVWLHSDRHRVKVQVKDDGKGFVVDSGYEGNGLKNMKARAGEIKALFTIESIPEQGTKVQVEIRFT